MHLLIKYIVKALDEFKVPTVNGVPRQDTAVGKTRSTCGWRRQSPGEKFLLLVLAARSWTVLGNVRVPLGELAST